MLFATPPAVFFFLRRFGARGWPGALEGAGRFSLVAMGIASFSFYLYTRRPGIVRPCTHKADILYYTTFAAAMTEKNCETFRFGD